MECVLALRDKPQALNYWVKGDEYVWLVKAIPKTMMDILIGSTSRIDFRDETVLQKLQIETQISPYPVLTTWQ